MGYFRELPDVAYQSPLSHKISARDYIVIKCYKDAIKLYNKSLINKLKKVNYL